MSLASVRHALLSLVVVGTACSHANGTGGPSTTTAPPMPTSTSTSESTAPGAGAVQASTGQDVDARAPEARVALTPLFGITINPPGQTPRAPPPVHTLPTLPTLPNLPAPSSYPKLARPPRGENIAECGEVWSGSEWVPVECADPNIGGQPVHPATVVIPYDKMRPPIEQLPRMVDHRADGTEGPIRKQGGAQCTAFAFTSALDHAYARWTGTPGAFSVMQVWARYHTHAEHLAVNNNVGDLIGSESDWPYDGKVAGTFSKCKPNKPKHRTAGVDCEVLPDEAKLQYLDARPVAVITKVELVSTSELGVLREKLAAGQDATFQIKLPSFAVAGDPGAKYVVGIPATPPAKPPGAHQILIAGYAMTPNGTYYLVHNSWGAQWADGGYAWLHEDFLKAFWADKVMVIPYVEPVDAASARVDPARGLSRACEGDQVPDSISGLCAGKCSDGSPRHNDVCASASDCPRGQVNLTGVCLLAAPRGAGVDAQNGVKWACGAGGCTYSMPRGALNCAENECAVSCPAPDFRLATTPRGFGCVD